MSGNSFGRENVGKRVREEHPVKFTCLRFILNKFLKTIEITEFVVTPRRNSGDSRTKSCSKDRRVTDIVSPDRPDSRESPTIAAYGSTGDVETSRLRGRICLLLNSLCPVPPFKRVLSSHSAQTFADRQLV